jgi:7-cyano-7-deazaguanine tRNA-ribosyltransferase
MSFEVRDKDLMGRIGRLKTKSGIVETPAFMPVINPINQIIPPRIMKMKFGCDIVITNSYIIQKNFGDELGVDVHDLIDYDGIVTTDSGAYQLLIYGDVDTTPKDIILFQQNLGSDIGVILDIPTGWNETRKRVEWTVEETIRRAKAAIPLIKGDEMLWIGPVQGGSHLDLVERSARVIGKLPFHIHALGSPTEVMQNYKFSVLTDMIIAAKLNIPRNRPLHLFGAGHPMMFSMAIALGCDLFDSAAYALYAREGRYITPLGTLRHENLRYLPCSCPICSTISAVELKEMLRGERIRTLTEHNLYVCMAEIRRVKQAITEGTLWDLMEARSRSHPALASALKRFQNYKEELEKSSPSFKGRGVFFFGFDSIARPEVTRHINRLATLHAPSEEKRILLLVTTPAGKPFSSSKEYLRFKKNLEDNFGEDLKNIQVCFYAVPYGVVPEELAQTFPLSQFEITEPTDRETLEFVTEQVGLFIEESNYPKVVLLSGNERLDYLIQRRCKEATVNTEKTLRVVSNPQPWSDRAQREVVTAIEHK